MDDDVNMTMMITIMIMRILLLKMVMQMVFFSCGDDNGDDIDVVVHDADFVFLCSLMLVLKIIYAVRHSVTLIEDDIKHCIIY